MTATSKGRKAALGVRCHSGWAAAILACGSRDAVTVLDRRRWQLCDSAVEGARQPYHHVEPMPLAEAAAFIDRCREGTLAQAHAAIVEIKAIAQAQKLALTTCSILS